MSVVFVNQSCMTGHCLHVRLWEVHLHTADFYQTGHAWNFKAENVCIIPIAYVDNLVYT